MMEKNKAKTNMYVMKSHDIDFKNILRSEFESRKSRNPRYSIRAFATFLEIDQSLLSKVMMGRKSISINKMCLVLSQLERPEEELEKFRCIEKSELKLKSIDEDVFEIVSNWQCFAILEMMTLKDFKYDVQIISQRLGVEEASVEENIRKLVRMGFLKEKEGTFTLSKPNNTWHNSEITSEARKKLQRSILEKSIHALDHVPFDLRDHSSVTIAVKKSQIPLFREVIKETRKQLSEIFQKEKDFDEVYQLSISLFPLTT